MKNFKTFISAVLFIFWAVSVIYAQDVVIDVPSQNIFNRSEFLVVKTVMNTQGSSHWRAGAVNPTVRSISGNNFNHRTIPQLTLPTSVLHWQLASIGGETAPFKSGDRLPGFKWFSTSDQTWYQPAFRLGNDYSPGNIDFKFKMPADVFSTNAFYAGTYSLEVTQNYGRSFFYAIEFSPDSFQVVLSIPAAITWINANTSNYTEVISLNEFRAAPAQMKMELTPFDLGNTVNFKLFAKSASSTIQFTSSKGATGTRNISMLNLGGNNPKINTLPLTSNWQDYTASNFFTVENGNKNNFGLYIALSKSDFKNYFFEAGTYKFQLNLNAKTPDNTLSSQQNVDVTLKVLPLSEITVPSTGTNVNFEFNTVAHYQNGQTKVVPGQLKLSNNENYELYVKSDSNFFRRSGVQSEVPSSILQVGVEGGSQNVTLSATSKKIVSNGTPVLDKELNIKYTIPAASAQTLVSKAKSTYSIAVVYSFTAL